MFHARRAGFSGGGVKRLTRRGVAGRKASGLLRGDFIVAGEWSVDRTADGTGGGTGDDIIGNGAQQAWAAGAGHEDRAQDARADPGMCLGHYPEAGAMARAAAAAATAAKERAIRRLPCMACLPVRDDWPIGYPRLDL